MDRNEVHIIGIVKSIKTIDEANGMKFDGMMAAVSTERFSGKRDEAVVLIPMEIKVSEGIRIGDNVDVYGAMQTIRNPKTGEVLVYVLACSFKKSESRQGKESTNVVFLVGTRVRKATFRRTPKGRYITDLFLSVPCKTGGPDCHIPCICWGFRAEQVLYWCSEGTRAQIEGRLQSREYEKQLEDGKREKRTCYEISVSSITDARDGEAFII